MRTGGPDCWDAADMVFRLRNAVAKVVSQITTMAYILALLVANIWRYTCEVTTYSTVLNS